MFLEELRKEVVFYGKQMLHSGLTMNTGGNISARDPRSGLIVIKPTSIPYDLINPEDVPIIDENGKIIEGQKAPSSEWPMHTLIYRNRPEVMAVVHTHSLYAIACSVANIEIPLITHEIAVYSSKPIKIAPFEIPGTSELGEGALKYLEEADVVILKHHGPLAIGTNLWHAFDAACALEQAAFVLYATKALGNFDIVPSEGLRVLRNSNPFGQSAGGNSSVVKNV
jgi:L-ribulose-5-phosphate 4-epimerase